MALVVTFSGAADEVLLREEFESLEAWEELYFDNIHRHTVYAAMSLNDTSVLSVRSDQSASGLIYSETFDVYDHPVLEWRWKAMNIVEAGDARTKEGDDYSIRVYVFFKYDPARMSAADRIGYDAARFFTGRYPPHASLNYIWANRHHEKSMMPNTFTSRSMMFVVDEGSDHLGQWRTHAIDIIEDYRRAFGQDPPSEASLAIMGDTDNTRARSEAFVDYIELRR